MGGKEEKEGKGKETWMDTCTYRLLRLLNAGSVLATMTGSLSLPAAAAAAAAAAASAHGSHIHNREARQPCV